MLARPELRWSPAAAPEHPFPQSPDTGDDLPVVFYLGAPHASWLSKARVPLFVSYRTLRGRYARVRGKSRWALDSGGFTELTQHGRWTISPEEYAEQIVRYHHHGWEHGRLDWAAPQDWMCEPEVIHGGRLPNGERAEGTGLSVAEHQERTIESVLYLRSLLAPEGLSGMVIPVLQGYEPEEYLHCVGLYQQAGVDLAAERLVGVGSVCRRQGSREIAGLVRELASGGLRLHGFGVKTSGLGALAAHLASCDSMAWSLQARHSPPLDRDCGHARCVTCPRYAMVWRQRLLDQLRAVASQAGGVAVPGARTRR